MTSIWGTYGSLNGTLFSIRLSGSAQGFPRHLCCCQEHSDLGNLEMSPVSQDETPEKPRVLKGGRNSQPPFKSIRKPLLVTTTDCWYSYLPPKHTEMTCFLCSPWWRHATFIQWPQASFFQGRFFSNKKTEAFLTIWRCEGARKPCLPWMPSWSSSINPTGALLSCAMSTENGNDPLRWC